MQWGQERVSGMLSKTSKEKVLLSCCGLWASPHYPEHMQALETNCRLIPRRREDAKDELKGGKGSWLFRLKIMLTCAK